MYDFSAAGAPRGDEAMRAIAELAPAGHTVRSSTSTLPKVLAWHLESPLLPAERIAHQADFLAMALRGPDTPVVTDWNNALKLGQVALALRRPPASHNDSTPICCCC
jgi:hypothetical protein